MIFFFPLDLPQAKVAIFLKETFSKM